MVRKGQNHTGKILPQVGRENLAFYLVWSHWSGQPWAPRRLVGCVGLVSLALGLAHRSYYCFNEGGSIDKPVLGVASHVTEMFDLGLETGSLSWAARTALPLKGGLESGGRQR